MEWSIKREPQNTQAQFTLQTISTIMNYHIYPNTQIFPLQFGVLICGAASNLCTHYRTGEHAKQNQSEECQISSSVARR